MARSGLLFALVVLAAAACAQAQARGMVTGSGMMSGKSGEGGRGGKSYNAVFSRGRATRGDAYLAACAPGCRCEMRARLRAGATLTRRRHGATSVTGTRFSSTRRRRR